MDSHELVETQPADYVSMAAKSVLGMAPVVGSLLAELAGNYIPNQRMDRIAKFCVQLEARLNDIERSKLQSRIETPEGADLLEEGMRQAASSLSDERREYIANLIARGISNAEINDHESKHLLRLLGELSDVEIIWLRFYADQTMQGDQEFRDRHAAVLEIEPAHMSSPQSVHDRNSLSKSYKLHLARLGLLQESHKLDDKTKQLKVDSSGRLEVKGYGLTSLGRLLLRSIGLPDGLN